MALPEKPSVKCPRCNSLNNPNRTRCNYCMFFIADIDGDIHG